MCTYKSVFMAAAYFASSVASQCVSWQMFQYYAPMPDGTVFDAVIQPEPISEKASTDPVCTLKTSNWDGQAFDCVFGWGASISPGLDRFVASWPELPGPSEPNTYNIDWGNNEFDEIPFAASTEGESDCCTSRQ